MQNQVEKQADTLMTTLFKQMSGVLWAQVFHALKCQLHINSINDVILMTTICVLWHLAYCYKKTDFKYVTRQMSTCKSMLFFCSMICTVALYPSRFCFCTLHSACACACVYLVELISAWRLPCQSRKNLSIGPLRHLQQLANAITGQIFILGNRWLHWIPGRPNEREEAGRISVFLSVNDRGDVWRSKTYCYCKQENDNKTEHQLQTT